MDYRNKTILPLVFLALAILFIWKIWPMLNGISKDKENMEILGAENTRLTALLTKINTLNSSYSKNEESVNKFSILLPDKDDRANLTAAFESLASASGLIMEKIIFSEPQEEKVQINKEARDKNNYETKIVELNLVGNYSSFKGFLKALENSLRVMDILYISFAPPASGASSSPAQYIFRLKFKTYLVTPIDENNLLGEISKDDITALSFVKEKKFSNLISLPDYLIKIEQGTDINNKNIFAP